MRTDAAAPLELAPSQRPRGDHGGAATWVKETRFGRWFLGTTVWSRYVVEDAMNEFVRLRPVSMPASGRALDAGCGPGVSLPLLWRHFRPEEIVAIDVDPYELERARRQAAGCGCRVEIRRGDVTRLDLSDNSLDLVLCHQTLHHVVEQGVTLREFHRVLRPGGILLLAESCRSFIMSAPVRLLFSHPNEVQKNAAEYLELVRGAGFDFGPQNVATTTPFWSRADWGLARKFGWSRKSAAEPTQVMVSAVRR